MPRLALRTHQLVPEHLRIGRILLDQAEAGSVTRQADLRYNNRYNNRSLEADFNVWM